MFIQENLPVVSVGLNAQDDSCGADGLNGRRRGGAGAAGERERGTTTIGSGGGEQEPDGARLYPVRRDLGERAPSATAAPEATATTPVTDATGDGRDLKPISEGADCDSDANSEEQRAKEAQEAAVRRWIETAKAVKKLPTSSRAKKGKQPKMTPMDIGERDPDGGMEDGAGAGWNYTSRPEVSVCVGAGLGQGWWCEWVVCAETTSDECIHGKYG